MRVGVIQSCFAPWRGYFDFINSVDIFVFYDDVQYSKNSWRNRNRIKTPKGSRWVTVPVRHRSLSQLIVETEIDDTNNWRDDHMRLWGENYGIAPYFHDIWLLLKDANFGSANTISELNIKLTRRICDYLNISTPMILSSDLLLQGSKTDRLINLLKKLNASTYLSGPSADDYLDKEAFIKANIGLEYKTYDYEPYPQLWEGFEGRVSVLDLIANCGPDSINYIKSRSPDVVVL